MYNPAEDVDDDDSDDDLAERLCMSTPAAETSPSVGKKKDLKVAMELAVSLDFH